MDQTPNLKLPYILAAQAQKHVTHNEAIRALDAIAQLSVLDRNLAAPPATPADGDRYIVAASATGDWAGFETHIAAWQDGAWMFYQPAPGWLAWIADEDIVVAWNGTAWVTASGNSLNPVTGGLIGINATADATNRLSMNSPASLFNHNGAGHQQKINKATAGDTASQLYQTNFSGRAETGLTGDDDFHFKVSPDGANWFESILIDKDTGQVSFPSGYDGRERLTGARNYYVRTDGNDANDGLDNTSGRAFATIQKALDVVGGLDLDIYTATIWVNDGTYTITSSLTYRGFQGGQVILRALNDPSTSPDGITLTGTKANDEAAVRAAHKVVVQASTATGLLYGDYQGAIGNIRGIAFIQTGAHTNAVWSLFSGPAMNFTQCTHFSGGSTTASDARVTFNNCLTCHQTGAGFQMLSGASIYSNNSAHVYSSGTPLQGFDASQLSMFNGKVIATATTGGTNFDRSFVGYFSSVTFQGGTNSLFVSMSDVRLDNCTFSGASARIFYLGNAGRALINGGSITSGAALIYAAQRSAIRIASAPTGSPTYSPALGTIGNNEAYINT